MKYLFFALILLFFASDLVSQPWIKNLPQGKPKGELTFSHYKDAFIQYWAPYNVVNGYYFNNGVKTKAAGWKHFKRWEYYIENQIDPITTEFPKQSAKEVFRDYQKAHPTLKAAALTNTSSWTSLGPTSSDGGYAGIGRISCIAFHPSDNNTWWIGAAAGGLWKTTDNGVTWTCLTDNNGVLAVSDIIISSDYATSNTIYIATGDKDAGDNRSIGVLKSTDGGTTWNTTGITYTLASNSMVSKLLVDPSNNQTILAATSNGVYKTTDGGSTWSTRLSTVNFMDLEYKPGDFTTLYGSTTSGTIYLSTDGGASWTQSFTNSSAHRIDLAVSPNNPILVYAIAANSVDGLYGIYKSTDSGATYSQVFAGTPKNLLGWNANGGDSGGQGWYDLSIDVSPSNATTLLIGGVNTWRSTNGGTSWSIVNHWSGSTVQEVHADKHMLRYRGDGNLFECNDGGVYISANNGTLWSNKTNGIVISQMYKLGVSQTTPNETITGLQDNGTKLLSAGAWSDVKGGDGMECLIDYTDANIQYGTYVNGQLDRTKDHWITATDISANIPGGLKETGAWVSPYIIDPLNPKILYLGYSDIYKTTDQGDAWTKISTMNTSSKIRSMAIAPSNPQVLYVADPTRIWKTTDGGSSWINITGTIPSNITNIAVKNDDENTLWVTVSGYTSSKVFQSISGGTTWTNISTGLPSIPTYTIVQNKQVNAEVQLYVGTELGVYFKKGTDNWIAYNTGLPNVSVGELEFYYALNPSDSKLRVATYGRGLWETPVYYTPVNMTYASSTTTQNKTANIFPNQTNQEIIGIQVVTDGTLNPLSATSFTFNTSGSTAVATDLSNAKLFYTGHNNSFGTSTQFGSTSVSPNGTFTITGTATLNAGTNFFWLTYDTPSGSVIGNHLDAQCTSLTVGTARIPTVTSPAGYRTITYCSAGSSMIGSNYISRVILGSIDQTSVAGTNGYSDYSAKQTTMTTGTGYSVSVAFTPSYSNDQVLIWCDWNNNGEFTDAGENVLVSVPNSGNPVTATITPPAGTPTETIRMRIRLHLYNNGPNTTPCGNSSYGEVEDYTLNIICSPPSAPTGTASQTFCFGLSPTVASLTATGSAIQWYSASSGGTALSSSTPLITGTHYYASQTVGNCESTSRFDVTATVNTTAAPTGTAAQTFCASDLPTVASLAATGTALKWYDASTAGNLISSSAALVNGSHYYASQTLNSCESPQRFDVTATINTTAAPTGTANQIFCASASPTVASLATTGTALKWYDASSAGNLISSSTALINATHYYASQTVNSCESASRLDIMATVNTNPTAPVPGIVTQPTCSTATGSVEFSGLPSSGSWILTESVGATTNSGTGSAGIFTNLNSGTYTFKVTDANGCYSPATDNIIVNSPPIPSTNKQLIVNVFLEGNFNTSTGLMNQTLNDLSLIPLNQPYNSSPWNYTGTEILTSVPSGIIDWVLVELRSAPTPEEALPGTVLSGWPRAYLLKSNGTIVCLDGITPPTIGNPIFTGNLYVIISHRNHISIMSNAGMTNNCNDYAWNFTDALTKAYGSSAGYKQLSAGIFGMVAGNADGDGSISVLDFSNWAADFGKTTIYLPSDIDEDGNVSVLDFSKWATNFGIGNIMPLKILTLKSAGHLSQLKFRSQVPHAK